MNLQMKPDKSVFSSCFSFQTRIDLILIKFYYNAVDVFWKLLEKLWGNDYVGNHF